MPDNSPRPKQLQGAALLALTLTLPACAPDLDTGPDEPLSSQSEALLTKPVLLAPSGAGVAPQPTYRFNAVTGATRYRLWVNDTTRTRIDAVYTASSLGCASGGVCVVSPATALSAGAAKAWVQALNDTEMSAWSSALSFTVTLVMSPPPAPVPTGPTATVMTTTPTYRWSGSTTADDYYLWVNDALGVRVQQVYSAAAAGCPSGGACAASPAIPVTPGNVRFWVQARNSRGSSAWSAAQSFVASASAPKPAAPTPTDPSGSISDPTPTYSWTASAHASEYSLWVNDATGTRIQVSYTPAAAGCAAASTCSVTPSTELGNGDARFWVQAKNAAGTSAWSVARTFTVSAAPSLWLAYIADPTADVDELWAVRVSQGAVGQPIRINLPLTANQDVLWMRWTADGRRLAYAVEAASFYVVDMSTPTPGPPLHVTGVGVGLIWSHSGRYAAFLSTVGGVTQLTVIDINGAPPTVRSVPFCPAAGCEPYITPPESVQWYGDWLLGLSYEDAVWGTRVTDGTPAAPALIRYASTFETFSSLHIAPGGAYAALRVWHRGSPGAATLESFTPQGGGSTTTGAYPSTTLEQWLPNGTFVYWGVPPWATDRASPDLYLPEGLPVFDLASPRISWKMAPNVRTLALVVNDSQPSAAALYLRRRSAPPDPPAPEWYPSSLAIADFSTLYEWARDSRRMLYAKSSLYVVDTAASPLRAPIELVGSIPAGATATTMAWGLVSDRILYTSSDTPSLKYIDFRDGTPRAPRIVTPTYTHGAGDAAVWRLAPNDTFVASSADFTQDGVTELYVTSVATAVPGAAQRVHPALSGVQDVASFAWQPGVVAVP